MTVHRALLIVAVVAATIIATACNGDEDPPATVTPTNTATAAPTATPTATATATATEGTPSPTPTATGTPSGGARDLAQLEQLIASLGRDPQTTEPDRQESMPSVPAPDFPDHDGETTVLYDIEAGEVHEFGPGEGANFSPDSRYMAWISHAGTQNELRVLDLETREERSLLAEDVLVGGGFRDNRRFEVRGLGGAVTLVDVETGESESSDAPDQPQQIWQVQGDLALAPAGEAPGHYRLVDSDGSEAVFEAFGAIFAGPGRLLVVTPIAGEAGASADGIPGTANLYLIDIDATEATFIATARFAQHPILPFGGSASVVAWTEDFCNWPDAPGPTRYLDRSSGELVELDASLWVTVTPDGRLGYGEFGPHVLVDLDTMQVDVVLPEGGTLDVNWSPDYRYASRGMAFGHGGHCPP